MRKKILFFVAVFALIAMTAMAASATIMLDYSIAETNKADTYKIVATINDDAGTFRAFKTTVSFDNSIFVPVSKTTGAVANIAGGTVKTPLNAASYYDEENEEEIAVSYTPGYPKWIVDGTNVTLEFESYTSTFFAATDLVVFEMYYKYADGKSDADIKDDSFVVEYVHYANGADCFYGNDDASKNNIELTNNVVPTASAALTIPVAAGDVIYFADGTTAVAEAAGDYEVPAADGIIAVNTGYDSQKVYEIANGKLSERTDLADGVLATAGVSIRKDAKATGVRFKSTFLTALKATVKEYGYIVTVDSAKNALPEDYTLDMALVADGKAKKGVAYSKANGTDIFYDVDGARTVVTMVTTGIPLTEAGVTTDVIARPYYVLDNGAVIYGETNTATAYQIAYAVREQGGTIYEDNKEYVDAILALVSSDNDGDNFIDMGYLFE